MEEGEPSLWKMFLPPFLKVFNLNDLGANICLLEQTPSQTVTNLSSLFETFGKFFERIQSS